MDTTKASLFIKDNSKINVNIVSSEPLPSFLLANQVIPHISSPYRIIPVTIKPPTPPPVGGSQTNFSIGWWMYVNDQPFVPNNTNFGEGWFMYANSR